MAEAWRVLKARAQSALPWVRAPIANFVADDGTVYAAGIAFYALVSLVPLAACILAVAGAFLARVGGYDEQAQAAQINELVDGARRFIPLLPEDRAQEILHGLIRSRKDIGVLGFIGLLGAASQVVDALRRAVARPFGTNVLMEALREEAAWKRGARKVWAAVYKRGKNFFVVVVLGFMVAGLRLMLTFAASLAQVLPSEWVDLVVSSPAVAFTISQGTGFLFAAGGYIALVSHLGRRTTTWKGRLMGGAVFAILLAIAELIYATYVVRFSNMSLTYGSLASLVAIALWIFYSSCVFLICAELTAVVSNPARLDYASRLRSGGPDGRPQDVPQEQP